MKVPWALVLVAVLGSAQAAEPFAEARAAWNKPRAPFQVIDNIYYVGTDDLAVFLIKTPEGDILLDGGLPESPPLIEKSIAALGVKLSDIKFILSSHGHFDHAGGLADLKKATGARLIAGAADAPVLERGYITFGPSAGVHFPPVHVDEAVGEDFRLALGGVTLVAHHTPGHTPGCTSWTTTVRDGAQTKSVIFLCSTSVAGNPLVGNTEYPQIATDYRATFAALQAMPADVFLAAHASFFDAHGKAARVQAGAPNPFVDPTELPRFVAASERAFNGELAKQQAAQKP